MLLEQVSMKDEKCSFCECKDINKGMFINVSGEEILNKNPLSKSTCLPLIIGTGRVIYLFCVNNNDHYQIKLFLF